MNSVSVTFLYQCMERLHYTLCVAGEIAQLDYSDIFTNIPFLIPLAGDLFYLDIFIQYMP